MCDISTACLGYSCRLSPVVSKASSGSLEVMEGLARLREERDIVEILQVSHGSLIISDNILYKQLPVLFPVERKWPIISERLI